MFRQPPDRAAAPAVAVVLLVAVAVVAAGALAAGLPGPGDAPPRAVLEASADAATDRVTLVHRGGDALAVEALAVRIAVDGEPLDHQPPVPFFSATGFAPGPAGPFNSGSDGEWTAGETAAVELAGTNEPLLEPGATVTVRVYSDGRKVAETTTTAG